MTNKKIKMNKKLFLVKTINVKEKDYMFLPREVFFEKNVENYELGRELLARYEKLGIPCKEIENHNNIEEMRKKERNVYHGTQ